MTVKNDWRLFVIKLLVIVWSVAVAFMTLSCNTVKSTTASNSESNDSSGVTSTTHFNHTSIDNLSVKNDNGSWSRIITYPPKGLANTQGVTVIETGNYNRDQTIVHHENIYDLYNVYATYNVYHHINVTTTKTEKSRFSWISALFLAVGGIGALVATRVPLIITTVLSLINFVISKLKTHKNQSNVKP